MICNIAELDAKSFAQIRRDDEMYVRTNGRKGKKAELIGTRFSQNDILRDGYSYYFDYSGLDLSGMDCSLHNFYHCDFYKTSFRGANLTNAKFFGSNLQYADFSGAYGLQVDMSYTVQDCAIHDKANYREGIFNFASGDKVSFHSSDMIGASFQKACLTNCDFQYADMKFSSLKNCKLDGSNLSYANLSHADGTRCSLKDTQCRGANFDEMLLAEAKLLGINVEEVYMASMMLVHAQHSLILAQFGPVGRNGGYITCNLENGQVSIPEEKKVLQYQEFAKRVKSNTELAPALAAFDTAKNLQILKNRTSR